MMLGLSMNSDKSCVACSCSGGFSIYNTNPFTRRMIKKGSGTSVIQMLNSTSLLALVPSGDTPGSSPRKLMLWNSQTKETICELPFPSTILAVRMNKNHLIAVLDSNIHIFELSSMNNIHTLSAPSNYGLIDLTHNINENETGPKKSVLAFKGMQGGDVVLFDCVTLRVLGHIKAHKSSLSALTFNTDATLFATASTKGTVIRVFSIPSAQHLMTFRRGSYSCTINSLCFSPCSKYLSAGSSSGTVHIFSLESNKDGDKSSSSSDKPKAASVFSISNILPEPAQEFAESTRAIVVTKIPNLDGEFIASLIEGQGDKGGARSEQSIELLKLIVCTRNGYLYRFSICQSTKKDGDRQPSKGLVGFHSIMEDEYNTVADFVDPAIK